jgi:hypothetical protein
LNVTQDYIKPEYFFVHVYIFTSRSLSLLAWKVF